MAEFERKNFIKKNIVTQDVLSIPGAIRKNLGTIEAGTVVAFDKLPKYNFL